MRPDHAAPTWMTHGASVTLLLWGSASNWELDSVAGPPPFHGPRGEYRHARLARRDGAHHGHHIGSRLGCGDLSLRQDFRVVHRTKGTQWVEIHGEPGIDPGILLERALVSAVELESRPTRPRVSSLRPWLGPCGPHKPRKNTAGAETRPS